MSYLVRASVLSLWFSVLFSFILGTVVSNLALLTVLLLLIFFIVFTDAHSSLLRTVFFGFLVGCLVLVFYLLIGELGGGTGEALYDSTGALEQVLYYIRGMVIIGIVFLCINIERDVTFDTFISCALISSLLILQSTTFEFFNFPGSLFDLVPQSLTERQYSGFTGFFNNPNYWAIFLLLNSFLCISGLIKKNNNAKTVLLLLSLTISVSGILATGSRMGIVGFLISCFFVSKLRSKKLLSTFLIFIFFLSLLIVFNKDFFLSLDFTVLEKSFSRFERVFNNVSEENRFQRAGYYLETLFSSPQSYFVGLGLSAVVGEGPPHNTIISIFRDFGLILPISGFSLAGILVFKQLKNNALCRHEAVLSKMTLISIPIILMTNDIFDSRPFWIMLGLVVSFLSLKKRKVNG
ncbi:hypothetical protein L1D55_22885 [Vibrio sp. Isolate22]|nr:hypothetical protein [Vibrio sp. Isolate22]